MRCLVQQLRPPLSSIIDRSDAVIAGAPELDRRQSAGDIAQIKRVADSMDNTIARVVAAGAKETEALALAVDPRMTSSHRPSSSSSLQASSSPSSMAAAAAG